MSRSVTAVTNLMKEIQKDFPSVSENAINAETFKGIACGVSLSFTAEETPRTVDFQTDSPFKSYPSQGFLVRDSSFISLQFFL